MRVFRDLLFNNPVLEIGRLRLWCLPGFWPRLPYCRHEYGCWVFGMGYLCAMVFDKRKSERITTEPDPLESYPVPPFLLLVDTTASRGGFPALVNPLHATLVRSQEIVS